MAAMPSSTPCWNINTDKHPARRQLSTTVFPVVSSGWLNDFEGRVGLVLGCVPWPRACGKDINTRHNISWQAWMAAPSTGTGKEITYKRFALLLASTGGCIPVPCEVYVGPMSVWLHENCLFCWWMWMILYSCSADQGWTHSSQNQVCLNLSRNAIKLFRTIGNVFVLYLSLQWYLDVSRRSNTTPSPWRPRSKYWQRRLSVRNAAPSNAWRTLMPLAGAPARLLWVKGTRSLALDTRGRSLCPRSVGSDMGRASSSSWGRWGWTAPTFAVLHA